MEKDGIIHGGTLDADASSRVVKEPPIRDLFSFRDHVRFLADTLSDEGRVFIEGELQRRAPKFYGRLCAQREEIRLNYHPSPELEPFRQRIRELQGQSL